MRFCVVLMTDAVHLFPETGGPVREQKPRCGKTIRKNAQMHLYTIAELSAAHQFIQGDRKCAQCFAE